MVRPDLVSFPVITTETKPRVRFFHTGTEVVADVPSKICQAIETFTLVVHLLPDRSCVLGNDLSLVRWDDVSVLVLPEENILGVGPPFGLGAFLRMTDRVPSFPVPVLDLFVVLPSWVQGDR
jgi:hypothetical protein